MTRSQMTRIVRGWQKRLRLQNYAITIAFEDNDPNGETADYQAKIKVADDYESARLTIRSDYEMWKERLANEVVLHELLHIFENGPACAVESLEEVLDDTAYKILFARYNSAAENMVDRLALIIVALAGVVPLPASRSAKRADG